MYVLKLFFMLKLYLRSKYKNKKRMLKLLSFFWGVIRVSSFTLFLFLSIIAVLFIEERRVWAAQVDVFKVEMTNDEVSSFYEKANLSEALQREVMFFTNNGQDYSPDDYFLLLTYGDWHDGWGVLSAAFMPHDVEALSHVSSDDHQHDEDVLPIFFFNILVVQSKDRVWQVAAGERAFSTNLLDLISLSDLSQTKRAAFFAEDTESFFDSDANLDWILGGGVRDSGGYESSRYKFPWPAGERWTAYMDDCCGPSYYRVGGWHLDSSGWALDFHPDWQMSDRTILASASGTVSWMCVQNDPNQQAGVHIRTDGTRETLRYYHIYKHSLSVGYGSWVSQGQSIGKIAEGVNGRASYCNLFSTDTHLHFGTPYKPITIDNFYLGDTNSHLGMPLLSTQDMHSQIELSLPYDGQRRNSVDYIEASWINNSGDYVSHVDYWLDGVLVSQVSQAPFGYSFGEMSLGRHEIVARIWSGRRLLESDQRFVFNNYKAYSFKPTAPGSKDVKRFVIQNRFSGSMSLGALNSNIDASDFYVQNNDCSFRVLQPGASCSFEVVFSPIAAGQKAVFLGLQNSQSGEYMFDLSGMGVYPDLQFNARSRDFGELRVGEKDRYTFEFINGAQGVLVFERITSLPAGFVWLDNGCSGKRLALGESCQLTVGFEPETFGSFGGQIVVSTNDPNSPLTLELSGLAKVRILKVGPKQFDMGGVLEGQSVSQVVVMQAEGNEALQIGGLENLPAGFTSSSDCENRLLQPGEQCVATISFSPVSPGVNYAWWPIRSNADNGRQDIFINAYGLIPDLWSDTSRVDFGYQLVGQGALVEINLFNKGASAAIFEEGSFVIDEPFGLSHNCTSRLEVDSSCQISISFEPSALGSFSQDLFIGSGANSSIVLPISGSGTEFNVPQASFLIVGNSMGSLPLRIEFKDTSQGIVDSWHWDFGDGSFSDERWPTHYYTVPGLYTVSLTVGNAMGSDSFEIIDVVEVGQRESVVLQEEVEVVVRPWEPGFSF